MRGINVVGDLLMRRRRSLVMVLGLQPAAVGRQSFKGSWFTQAKILETIAAALTDWQ